MKRLLLTGFCLVIFTGIVWSEDRKELTSRIKKVTVFVQGAQVEREVPVDLAPGTHEITIPELTPLLDPATLQTKGTDNISIISVRTGRVYNEARNRTAREDSLKQEAETLQMQEALTKASLEVLADEEILLTENRKLPMDGSASWADKVEETAAFYRKRLKEISLERLELNQNLSSIRRKIDLNKMKVAELPDEEPEEKTEIYLEVNVKRRASDKIIITYQVANARWFPEYDFRITDLQSPLSVAYKAKISQQTGEDWENVKLVVNTGSPDQAGQAPEAVTWWLRPEYERYQNSLYGSRTQSGVISSGSFSGTVSGRVVSQTGEGIPGVSVVVPGNTIGTVTEIDGSYTLEIPNGTTRLLYQYIGLESVEHAVNGSRMDVVMKEDLTQLNEVVVTAVGMDKDEKAIGYAINRSPVRLSGKVAGENISGAGGNSGSGSNISVRSTLQNVDFKPAPKEFDIDGSFSLASDPKPKQIRLESYLITADYQYFALPRKDQRAYLQAKITDWQQLNMLDGNANLFLENTFLGRVPFVKDELSDTLQIDLGPDPKVQVNFETVKDLSGTQFIGNKKKENHVYEIKVRNNRAFPVAIEIADLVPVPSLDNVDVERIGEGGNYDEEEGIIRWNVVLPSSASETIRTGFEVKYPSRIKLQL